MTNPEILVEHDAQALAAAIARRFEGFLSKLQGAGRTPRVLLTGGTIAMAA